MELLILNSEFEGIHIIDTYKSLIWVDRYDAYGDFELYLPADKKLLEFLVLDYYVWCKKSEKLMIIEHLSIETDVEDGDFFLISGRSLESILDRRIVWKQTVFNGDLGSAINTLINNNVKDNTNENRFIENFDIIAFDLENANVYNKQINTQFTGTNLYEAVQSLCKMCMSGFKIILGDDNRFKFKLYLGIDRSYDQFSNPHIVFSPTNDNLLNSNYFVSLMEHKNVALVAGEGEGLERTSISVSLADDINDTKGLNRREMFVDARDLSSSTESGDLTETEYADILTTRGINKLSELQKRTAFESELEALISYQYGIDFFMGDIVQIENEYGQTDKVYISEVIISSDESGEFVYPTFQKIDDI